MMLALLMLTTLIKSSWHCLPQDSVVPCLDVWNILCVIHIFFLLWVEGWSEFTLHFQSAVQRKLVANGLLKHNRADLLKAETCLKKPNGSGRNILTMHLCENPWQKPRNKNDRTKAENQITARNCCQWVRERSNVSPTSYFNFLYHQITAWVI